MHVAYLTPEYPHSTFKRSGGLGTSIKNLAVCLANNGHKATVVVLNQQKDSNFFDEGVSIIGLKRKEHRLLNWYFERKRIAALLRSIIKETGIQLLEAPDWTGPSAFMKFNIPVVIRFHGSDTYFCKLESRRQKFKNYLIERWAIKAAEAYIAPTTFAGNLSRQLFQLNSNKIQTINYGLDLTRFNNPTPETYKRHTLLYIGTVIRKKGVLELAKIFSSIVDKVPNAKLFMIGSDAPDISTKRESTYELFSDLLSESAKQRCHYLGEVPYDEVQKYIKNAHVCVFPSFAETLGMVTIESMALKKPVVNTNIGWAKELIEDGISGYLVHPRDIQSYAKTIINLFENHKLCLDLGHQARKRVESKFDIKIQVKKNIEYYQQILSSRK